MSRADLAALEPAALDYPSAALAGLLTAFGDDLAAGECPCAAG